MTPDILEVRDLSVSFQRGRGDSVAAVSNVSFGIAEGQTMGLVGESGCGKSTTARCILGLIKPTGGSVLFRGTEVGSMHRTELRSLYRQMQIVFQDPYASLNPKLTVRESVGEGLKIHRLVRGRSALHDRVVEVLELVGMGAEHLDRYPHAFSGGQRQRIAIARALAVEPAVLICDEPVTALDASIRAQVLNLFTRLQGRLNLTLLFISHDLAVINHIADNVAVMKAGKIVELGTREEVFTDPKHDYTRELLLATPVPDPVLERSRQRVRQALQEELRLGAELLMPGDPAGIVD
jgi:oligopeptide transport system ATP-binding protein